MRADSVQNWGAQIMLNIKKEKDGEISGLCFFCRTQDTSFST